MEGIKTFISSIFNGTNQAFIYIWLSKSEKMVYVGQTNQRYGTLGRGYSHVQSTGTLRCRCRERIGLNLEDIDDLYLFTFPLPNSNEFISTESAFRLATEYLVQIGLNKLKKDITPSFVVISNVMTTDNVNNHQVKQISKKIINQFIEEYKNI
jgi:hypothetical protein